MRNPRYTSRQCTEPHKSSTSHHNKNQYSNKPVCTAQVETQKDRSLRRRIQSLQCFLFEQLHKELNQAQPHSNPAHTPPKAADALMPTTSEPATSLSQATPASILPLKPAAQPSAAAVSAAPNDQSVSTPSAQDDAVSDTADTASTPAAAATTREAGAATASEAATATASEAAAARASGAAGQDEAGDRQQQEPNGDAAREDAAVEGASSKTVIDGTFGIVVKQRTKVLTGVQANKFRESRSFQVRRASKFHSSMYLLWLGSVYTVTKTLGLNSVSMPSWTLDVSSAEHHSCIGCRLQGGRVLKLGDNNAMTVVLCTALF